MNYDRRITLLLAVVFGLLVILVGLERAALVSRQLQQPSQSTIR